MIPNKCPVCRNESVKLIDHMYEDLEPWRCLTVGCNAIGHGMRELMDRMDDGGVAPDKHWHKNLAKEA